MRETRWWLHISAVLLLVLVCTEAGAPFKKVSIATTTASTTTTTAATTEPASADVEENGKPDNGTAPTKNSKLTGIPQIDYIWDPNLPRELRGYNLSNYPFFSTVPPEEDIHFKCDNLHDGFYASIEHHCQLYHHCVYGIRHDFLCANFTAFDQKTFICHFVSDVDCEGSKKYWNRNDDLYMATTTTSTTTTTTEPPPPTPRKRPIQRPLRPLRRPVNRRPIDDYYYDEVEEYDDDYYEERLNRRRKQRPRVRQPVAEYDDEYEDKRSFPAEDEKPRRPAGRDRIRDPEDDLINDYDTVNDRRKADRPKPKNKPAAVPERRKIGSRKPGTLQGRPSADERRSFNDEKPIVAPKENKRVAAAVDEAAEADIPPRRLVGRRRINEKRTSPSPATVAALDELDDYDKNQNISDDLEELNGEEASKVKATPKPLEEFVTPKAAPSSVYSRPRAPPRIARPVPVTEKKKYQYAVQKTATTTPSPSEQSESEDYYQDEYDDSKLAGGHPRRKIVEAEQEEEPPAPRRRNNNKDLVQGKKATRPTLRKPVTEKTPAAAVDDYYDPASEESLDNRAVKRRRPGNARRRPAQREADDVDFVDEDYDDSLLRPAQRNNRNKQGGRKKLSRKPIKDDDYGADADALYERPLRNRVSVNQSRRKSSLIGKTRQNSAALKQKVEEVEPEVEADPEAETEEEVPIKESNGKKGSAVAGAGTGSIPNAGSKSGKVSSVRVVKRPFLPSRGGSPYLPRGLQPVGIAQKPFDFHTTDITPIDMVSTISGVRLLEHGLPLLREPGLHERNSYSSLPGPRTTLPPRSAIPVSPTRPEPQTKINLEELYENDYDVTLNDALDPTLKPLSSHSNQRHLNHFNSNSNNNNNNYNNNKKNKNINRNSNNSNNDRIHDVDEDIDNDNESDNNDDYNQSYQSSYASAPVANTYPFKNPSISVANDIRRRAIVPAAIARSSRTDYRGLTTRIAQHFYDDYQYQ